MGHVGRDTAVTCQRILKGQWNRREVVGGVMDVLIKALENRDRLTEQDQSILRGLSFREATFRAGEDIVHEGSTPTSSSLLVSGLAARTQVLPDGERQICAFHVPGDFVDLHSYLLNEMDHG